MNLRKARLIDQRREDAAPNQIGKINFAARAIAVADEKKVRNGGSNFR